MSESIFFSIFLSVFLAELGDKTQLATMLFATDSKANGLLVFCASSLALVFSSGLAVLLGKGASRYLESLPLKLIAGLGFILIGCFTLYDHFRG